ncbi:MAG: SpoIIE family protein phosphatase [Saccharofermentans sp.]|nr:SpoIIE family protein phosphatase [Saccharofermentans sp.]
MSDLNEIFTRMIGTLAVVLVIAGFIGGSDILSKYVKGERKWMFIIITGLLGGIFGIYGNISGVEMNGSLISVRDMGPMLAGFIGGPVSGIIAGFFAGLHRLTMGGVTAPACIIATCLIGLICGFISNKWHDVISKPWVALIVSISMEILHMLIVLIMVKPFATALEIVRQIALPFIIVNSIGFVLMIIIITYTDRQRSLALEKNRMQSELDVANVIQHSLLPLISEEYPGCKNVDISASMEAAKEVGGDFYDVFYVDPTHLAFVIGDVSGKGVPAALFMASSKITLQNCIRDLPTLSEALDAANYALCSRNEAKMFVTVWVGVLDLTTGEITFSSAGHNPPVLIRDNKAEFLKVKNGFVLAGMEGIRYKEHKYQLEDGDIVLLYTDGVTEAEDKSHNLYGDDRLIRCLDGKSNNNAGEITTKVKASVDTFVNGNAQFDDLTMLCFKIHNS